MLLDPVPDVVVYHRTAVFVQDFVPQPPVELSLIHIYTLDAVRFPEETGITDLARYRGRSIPATGAQLKTEDSDDKQLSPI